MHLGGIGTGNFEIGCDGRFTNWQLFNTLRDGQVPLMFAVKAGDAVRLLQTAGGPDWPRVERIEMTGEYPIATLRYLDAELPVGVELSAFTPFAPLDARFSSQPLAVLIFRLHNPTAQQQTVSLAALMLNPVGYEAEGEIKGMAHAKLGGNVNEPFGDGPAAGLLMRAEPRKPPPATPRAAGGAEAVDPAKACGFGTLALVALADAVTVLPAFEDWNVAWEQFKSHGALPAVRRTPSPIRRRPPAGPSTAAVAATVDVPAGGSVEVPFLLAWHYPNKYSPPPEQTTASTTWIGCHYATLWPDAKAVIHEAAANLPAHPPPDGVLPQDVLPEHAPLLAAGLHHLAGGHDPAHRRGVPHRQRRRLRLGRLQRLLPARRVRTFGATSRASPGSSPTWKRRCGGSTSSTSSGPTAA